MRFQFIKLTALAVFALCSFIGLSAQAQFGNNANNAGNVGNANNANNANNGNNNFGNFFGNAGSNPFINNPVGGVAVDSRGVVSNSQNLDAETTKRLMEAVKQPMNLGEIGTDAKLRVISLKKLESAIKSAKASNTVLADEYLFMAGLQRIEFVIVSPQGDDVFLAGPAEGWKLNEKGIVVGEKSGTPVLHLEDFLAALRSNEAARSGKGISVSIDPTEAGVRALQQFYKKMSQNNVKFRPEMQADVERTMGEQQVTLTGVPMDSRFAQVLVAADYRMKQLSMGFVKAPIDGMPSVMEMAAAKNGKVSNSPRFWMECNYEPISKSEDGKVFQIKGQGVKALTENGRFDAKGKAIDTGTQDGFAAKWAKMMTEKFEQLSAVEPSFRELRNVMDMSVVAALIEREKLVEKTGLTLTNTVNHSEIQLPKWNVPKAVPTQCSFIRSDNSWLVSASGGVQLDPWGVAQKQEVDTNLNQLCQQVASTSDRWWWNAN